MRTSRPKARGRQGTSLGEAYAGRRITIHRGSKVNALPRLCRPGEAILARLMAGLCKILQTNFYEKALFVKPTWRLRCVANATAAAALPSALCFYPHCQ
jgi:hypothetical protein